jgi:hypothetical protein
LSRLRFKISMSLDGFVAGPSQSVDNPARNRRGASPRVDLPQVVWRAMHGLEGGEVNVSTPVEESPSNVGATIMGRNMFGGHPGPWVCYRALDRLVGS